MNLTDEQQAIQDKLLEPETKLIAANAVSGAGKTSLLVSIANTMQVKNGLYLAYNKAIATEASCKFPDGINCMTTHSLAYANTVYDYKLKIANTWNYRNITDKITYEQKLELASLLSNFCLSSHTSIDSYTAEIATSTFLATLAKRYLSDMQSGKIECSHEFYLKLYHILLANSLVVHEEFDIIMLDEAGDLNPVTIEIFKLLPAKKKIIVGDDNQNIYSFNNTVNGFEIMKDEAINMSMTQSFRVASPIAMLIENFCRNYLNPDMAFRGVDYTDTKIKTSAFISRTNSALIGEMIDLNKRHSKYNLVRPAAQIFKLPLTLLSLKPGKFVSPEFKHLQDGMNDYHKDPTLFKDYPSLLSYLLATHPDDLNLKTAINLITKYGPKEIMEAYTAAKSHEGTRHPHTLCTAHSSKGLEFDHVEIAEDLNSAVDKVISVPVDQRTNALQEEFRLYYVAVSRCRHSLSNARHLTNEPITRFAF